MYSISICIFYILLTWGCVHTQRNGPEDYPCAPRDGDAASRQITLATRSHSCAAVKCGFFAAELLTLGVVLDHNMYIYIYILLFILCNSDFDFILYYNLLLCFIPLEMHVRLICAIKFYLLTYLSRI